MVKQSQLKPLVDIESVEFDNDLGELHEVLRQRKAEFVSWVYRQVSKRITTMRDGKSRDNVIDFETRNCLTFDLDYWAILWLKTYGKDNRPPEAHIQHLEQKFAGLFDDEEDDVNSNAAAGLPLLHKAVMDNNLEEIKRLVEKGADLTRKDNGGRTALERAEAMGFDCIAKFLSEIAQINTLP